MAMTQTRIKAFRRLRRKQHIRKKVFGTAYVKTSAETISRDGEGQLTTEQRHKMQEDKRKRIVSEIVRNAWNPQTKTPHPPLRIENCVRSGGRLFMCSASGPSPVAAFP